jgi:hypothetical protein
MGVVGVMGGVSEAVHFLVNTLATRQNVRAR